MPGITTTSLGITDTTTYVVTLGSTAVSGATAGDIVIVTVGTQTLTYAIGADADATAANLAAKLTSALGAAATVVASTDGSGTVSVTGSEGAALPTISFSASGANLPSGGITTEFVPAVAAFDGTPYDISEFTGLTQFNAKSIGGTNIVASETENVTVINSKGGEVQIDGGLNQTVTQSGPVSLSGATGAVSVKNAAQGAANITVDGGTSVNITTTATSGQIAVGTGTSATAKPTGAIDINETVKGSKTDDTYAGSITVKGGTTVAITQTASQPAPTATTTTAQTTFLGATTVTGGKTTTSVSVTQSTAATAVDYQAAAGSKHADTVTFVDLAAGATAVVGGLTFTAGALGATAAQVATAFSNLANGALAGSAPVSVGKFSGSLAAFTSGAASGNTVVFTGVTNGTAAVVATGSATAPTVRVSALGHATQLATGTAGVVNGNVTIVDANATSPGIAGTKDGSITTVTANNFNGLDITSNALSTLTISGGYVSAAADAKVPSVSEGAVTIYNDAAVNAATTLDISLSGANLTGLVDTAGNYATVNTTMTGNSKVAGLSFAGATTLNLAGTGQLDLVSITSLAAIKSLTISNAASLANGTAAVDLSGLTTLKAVNASATSGNVNVKIDGSKTTYEGGTGADKVTLSSATVSKAVALGAGNDTVTLATGTPALTAKISGGDGTDTLSIGAADAKAAQALASFITNISGFEVLKLTGTGDTLDTSLLGFSNFNVATSSTQTLAGAASGSTVTIDTGAAGGVTMTNTGVWDAVKSTADSLSLNVSVKDAAHVNGSVTTTGIETIAIASSDLSVLTTSKIGITNVGTLTLVDASTKAVTLSGTGALTLTATGAALTTIDASAMTGNFSFTTGTSKAMVVTGGAGDDVLTASTSLLGHTLNGGAGNDTLTANAGTDVLTGGAGNDTFVVATPGSSVGVFTTITDFGAGDTLTLKVQGTDVFAATKFVSTTATSLTEYLNAAVNGTDGSTHAAIKWFQFNGDTYVVESMADHTSAQAFGTSDLVVKLTGTVDLSHAAVNGTSLVYFA